MNAMTILKPLLAALAVAIAIATGAAIRVMAHASPSAAQNQVPSTFSRPDQARFRLLAEEGILQPDGRTYVVGSKVWTVADKTTGQCYLLFFAGSGAAVSGPIACP